jgi:inorganic pyrophosphatase
MSQNFQKDENIKSEKTIENLNENTENLDLIAYGDNYVTLHLEKKIMKRFFNAFDITHSGFLNKNDIDKLCNYLSKPMSKEESELFSKNSSKIYKDKLNFDEFFDWWNKHSKNYESKKILSMISNEFDVPYHHQQLIIKETGKIYTNDYRINHYLKNLETNEIKQISPWHNIPLYVKDYILTVEKEERNKYNFICEIPKWTRAKFEIATKEKFNPIKQDIKNEIPRFYKHGDMMWNYGAFPQTWEGNDYFFLEEYKGDSDPVDVIEIGMKQLKSGEICQVKVLGVLGMIDEGEMDWKVICISCSDPISTFLNDINDVPKYLPGCLEAIREWLRTYKICQGCRENKFAFDGKYEDKKYAMKLIDKSHRMWAQLKKIDGVHVLS